MLTNGIIVADAGVQITISVTPVAAGRVPDTSGGSFRTARLVDVATVSERTPAACDLFAAGLVAYAPGSELARPLPRSDSHGVLRASRNAARIARHAWAAETAKEDRQFIRVHVHVCVEEGILTGRTVLRYTRP